MKRESFLLRAVAPWCGARRLLILASFLAIVLLATPAWGGTPCCNVTAIDVRTGIVTARETASGRSFQFKVTNPAQLRGLKVGQKVHANFGTQKVSLDGIAPCCNMVNLGAQGSSPMGATASAATSGSTKTKTTTGGGLGSIKTDTSNVKASEGTTAGAIRGAAPSSGGQATSQAASAQEPADEDAQDDSEPAERPKPRQVARLNLPGVRAGSKGTRMKDYPQAQQMMDDVIKAIMNKEIDVALIGGEKYKVNKCLGIKASAGTFQMKLASPNLRMEDTGVRLTFRIAHVSMNALKIRMRPNAGNPLKLCHWSKKFTVGGAAKDVTYEFRFDPILDLQQCKLGSMGQVKGHFEIGNLNLKPLQNDLDKVAKNMVEDAMNYAGELNAGDRVIAGINGFLAAKCHK